MASARSHLLPQHDVYPDSPWAKRCTLIGYAAACLVVAVFAGPVGTDTLALFVAFGVLLFMAWRTPQRDKGETSERKLRD